MSKVTACAGTVMDELPADTIAHWPPRRRKPRKTRPLRRRDPDFVQPAARQAPDRFRQYGDRASQETVRAISFFVSCQAVFAFVAPCCGPSLLLAALVAP